MELLLQPPDSFSCGQHCVAMITGKTVKEVCSVIGKTGGTNAIDLVNALNHFGRKTKPILHKLEGLPPDLCIVNLKWNKAGYGHWIVVRYGWVYDPGYGKYKFDHLTFYKMNGRAVSFLRIDLNKRPW